MLPKAELRRARATIMIVEDEGLIANDLADQLSRAGYAVSAIVPSGEEAVALLAAPAQQATSPGTILPDLILMDIRLSGKLDGIDTAAQLRTRLDVPVVFLTAHADDRTLDRATLTDPFGYLVKPVRPGALRGVIELALYRHKLDARLRQRETWLSTVLRSTPDLTLVTDPEGRVQFCNPEGEKLLGLTAGSGIGMPVDEVVHLHEPQSLLLLKELVKSAISHRANTVLPGGVRLHTRDCRILPVEGEVTPSLSGQGAAGAVITLRDVSERILRERELAHNQKMLAIGRMAGGLAHDFNNLLTVILGYGERLRRGLSVPPEERRTDMDNARLDRIIEAARSAAGITQQLLTLSGKGVVAMEILDVNEAVQRIAAVLRESMAGAVRLLTFCHPAAGRVKLNPSQFDQVLMNLILNARDALAGQGRILVSTGSFRKLPDKTMSVAQDYVRILVADNGPGIEPDAAEHIFEPFFTTKAAGAGLGLGLSIVYGIVKDAGGEISVRSTSGAGAIFEVLLPRAEGGEPAAAQPVLPGEARGPNKKNVLLVDDQPRVREMLRCFLEEEGFSVLVAADAKEALETAGAFAGEIDALVTDISLAGMDGTELAALLCDARPRLRVLFMSGYAAHPDQLLRAAGQASSFVQKPFGPHDLLDKLEHLLECC